MAPHILGQDTFCLNNGMQINNKDYDLSSIKLTQMCNKQATEKRRKILLKLDIITIWIEDPLFGS